MSFKSRNGSHCNDTWNSCRRHPHHNHPASTLTRHTTAAADLDALVNSRTWANRFLTRHLEPRGLEEHAVALKFLALTQPVQSAVSPRGVAAKPPRMTATKRRDLTRLFLTAADLFFDDTKDATFLALNNDDLYLRVAEVKSRLERSPKVRVTENDLRLLLLIREEVKCDGLEKEFMKWIVNAGPEGPMACLLSIL